jgi:endo-1,4-beta-xylanase
LRILSIALLLPLAFAPRAFSQKLSEADLLGQADARIQKYRTGKASLRLMGPSGQPLRKGLSVKIVQTRHQFLFGSNIFMLGRCRTPEENAEYARRFAALFNYATAPFYWWMYEPEEGHTQRARLEKTVRWCLAHGITVKGHPLAWNFSEPSWLPEDPAQAMQLQFARIRREVSQFAGQINYWDVVNEATHYDRPECQRQAPILTRGIAQMGVPAYLHKAFRTARAANPRATLVINDYDLTSAYARDVLSKLVDSRGRPLYDVIGLQAHQHAGAWPPEKIWNVCERFRKFGRPLHITETTILSGQLGYDLKKKNPAFRWPSTPAGEARQTREVVRFYTLLFSNPAVQAITWWDLSDQGAWQGAPAGLLRQDMTPKPAYNALYHLIKQKWWTRTTARVARHGAAHFHGFFGDYRLTVASDGRALTGRFSFDKTTHLPIVVRLQ